VLLSHVIADMRRRSALLRTGTLLPSRTTRAARSERKPLADQDDEGLPAA
jgi:hypothetical protein